jgi:hypothetical protein
MNKSIAFLLFVLLVGMGCKTNQDMRPPFVVHAVHNTCTNVWAVKTFAALPYGVSLKPGPFEQHTDHYWGQTSPFGIVLDSSEDGDLGHEYQFNDSSTAMQAYIGFCVRRDLPGKIRDSIFKCQHTYQ